MFQKFEIDCMQVSELHTFFMIAYYFKRHIDKIGVHMCRQMVKHLNVLFTIFAIDTIIKKGSNLMTSKLLTSRQLVWLEEILDEKLF